MAYLIPAADDYLGPGGHVKMHTAVMVDNAAPEGALATFEIELDEITGKWQIRPTSRPS